MSESLSKRDRFSKASASIGLTFLLELCPRRNSLLVLNYHRIGNWRETPYDEEMFSADEEGFAAQLLLLKKKTAVLSLDEALDVVSAARSFRGTAVLLTFDDGYLDNYRIAFPILRAVSLPATFFLATSFVGSCRLPWWDELAFLIRNSPLRQLSLRNPTPMTIDLGTGRRSQAIGVLARFCRSSANPHSFLDQIRALRKNGPSSAATDRLFLDWHEARDMAAHGMSIGAHTESHCRLASLALEEQEKELTNSKREVEANVGTRVDALAYPYGTSDSFNADTLRAVEKAGYRAAFSYYGGINWPGEADKRNLLRASVDHTVSLPRLRFRVATAPLFRGCWF